MAFWTFLVSLLTVVWIAAACGYIYYAVGLDNFLSLLPNEVGDFVFGVAAPLAFLWLVLGYFKLGHHLRTSNDALRESIEAFAAAATADELAGDDSAAVSEASEGETREAEAFDVEAPEAEAPEVESTERRADGDVPRL